MRGFKSIILSDALRGPHSITMALKWRGFGKNKILSCWTSHPSSDVQEAPTCDRPAVKVQDGPK
eukprot:scaffold117130_cov22-Prasinocladus_malaysianus.AAC.1